MSPGLDLAIAAHLARPLSVTRFARADMGFTLFPKQAEFLEACFPAPANPEDRITNPAIREAVMLAGKGAGKDTVAAVAQMYVAYRLSLLESPQKYLGLSELAPNVDLVNVAQNAKQARDVFFAYLKAMLRQSDWFSTLLPSFRDWRPDRDVLAGTIRFPNDVYAHSLHSQAKAAEGYNTFFGVMDEADAFRESSEEGAAENADEVHGTLLSSMASRFPKQHLLVVLSWPRHLESFTVRRYEAAQKGEQRVYGMRGATWEIRPDRTIADFAADYERNPEEARAKYECLPPAAVNAFFTMPEKIDAAMRGDALVEWEPTSISIKGQAYRAVNLVATKPPPKGAAYWVHGDAGLTGDSYGLAFARADGPLRIVDAVIEWRPRPGEPVFFPDVERVIMELRARGFTILGVTFDRWNSAETIQRLGAAGLFAEALTFTNPQQLELFENLKTLAYTDRLVLPRAGPAAERLRHELRRLQLLRGIKVDHPKGEGKDLADSVAAACFRAYQDEPLAMGEQPVAVSTLAERATAMGGGSFNEDLLRPPW